MCRMQILNPDQWFTLFWRWSKFNTGAFYNWIKGGELSYWELYIDLDNGHHQRIWLLGFIIMSIFKTLDLFMGH